MTQEDKEFLIRRIEWEGFDYCFDGNSSWKGIEDNLFHCLRENYLKAKKQLEDYLKSEEHDNT